MLLMLLYGVVYLFRYFWSVLNITILVILKIKKIKVQTVAV